MSLRHLFASTCNLWRQLFRNLGMKITTIVWVDSKNNGWLPWIPFPHQTTDPLRWKTRPGMSEDTYPCSWSVRELMFQLIMSLLKTSLSAAVISWLKNNAFHNRKLLSGYDHFSHKSSKVFVTPTSRYMRKKTNENKNCHSSKSSLVSLCSFLKLKSNYETSWT